MDLQVVAPALLKVVEQTLAKMTTILPSAPPETKTVDIVEYDGRMRVSGVEKFNAISYISIIHYYLNQNDLQKHKDVKVALLVYFDSENAGKMYKALGFPVPDDEDDISMMHSNGQVCQLIADDFKNELAGLGFPNLVMSEADSYKNTVMHGVEYSQDQKTKIEIIFTYMKRKSIAVELIVASK